MAQSYNQNFIKNTRYRKEFNETTKVNAVDNDKIESVTYYDGLGRPIQTVNLRAGGQKQDIVTHIEYDALGRQLKEYLPYAETTNNGIFRTNALTSTESFYNTSKYENTLNPFSEKLFDNSPLNRVIKQAAPGEDWALSSDHTIKFDYSLNIDNEVKFYKVEFENDNTEKPTLVYDGFYLENQLYKNIVKDENWTINDGLNHTTEEFKDKLGRVILKRTYNNDEPHDTQYVYDQYGNLTYVISPLAADIPVTEVTTPGVSYPVNDPQIYTYDHLIDEGEGPFWNGELTTNIVSTGVNTYEYTIDFDMNITFATLKTGNVYTLPNGQDLPDTTLFYILNKDIAHNEYAFKILNGNLHIELTGTPFSVGVIDKTNTFVLEGQEETTQNVADQNTLDDLCYQYKYDHRNRLVEKKIPGKGWEHIVYNKLDQPILTQDSEQRAINKWLFTKYDAFGRVVYTGEHSYNPTGNETNSGRIELQEDANNHSTLFESRTTSGTSTSGTSLYYTNNAFPNPTTQNILTINYYDDYGHINARTNQMALGSPITNNVKGLSVGSEERVLGTNTWNKNYLYYNEKGQVIRTDNHYYNGAHQYAFIRNTFEGNVDAVNTYYRKSSSEGYRYYYDRYAFDHIGRPTSTTQFLRYGENNSLDYEASEVLSINEYDELGQLKRKKVGNEGGAPLQFVDYTYNIRGWLKQINDPNADLGTDLFAFQINYNTKEMNTPGSFTPLYNGNIHETIWKTANDEDNGNVTRAYGYKYDALNRITNADYGIKTDGNYNLGSGYDLRVDNYDKNGNITSLYRNSQAPGVGQDDLRYFYEGNQLMKVDEMATSANYRNEGFKNGTNSGNDYAYDTNGNMIQDLNKGIQNGAITYNHLNLPEQIIFNNDINTRINYLYTATGQKLKKTVTNGTGNTTTTEYLGNVVYVDDAVQFLTHAEGYAEHNENDDTYEYIYQHKDHLGNIRLSYKGDYQYFNEDRFDTASEINSWTPYGGASISHDNTNKNLKVTMTNANTGAQKTVAVNSGDRVRLSIMLHKGTTSTAKVSYTVNELDANENVISTWNIPNPWSIMNKNITIKNNGAFLQIKAYKATNDNQQTFFSLDDFEIKKLDGTEIVEENNYYPFGLKHKGYNNVILSEHKHKFNGQEYEKSLGLNVTEMTFRQYDNALGRFIVIDPAAEMARNWTPYRFGFNNPILFSDPTGLWEKKKDGSWTTNDKKDIARFLDMLGAEEAIGGSVSGAQMDTFIKEEDQGSGGRLSDGSALLDSQTIKADRTGKSNGFEPYQVGKISSQIDRFVSNPWNEKSMGSNGHWAYSYQYNRERSYYANGGEGLSGVALSGFTLSLASDYMRNNSFWFGKNMKFYDTQWGGNGATGGKNKFAGKWSTRLGKVGAVVGLYGMYGTYQDYQKGKFSDAGASYLGASDAVGLRRIEGAAWSFGTSIGKAIVESNWYFNNSQRAINW
ncbi:hypothetical protein LPB138_08830 [Urechidicola croceus]|uniref:DUF6443 domain-containing protein n=2 Tax=Urechidicola croceus TaxID=1850246 RepID=A0A1D8P881_9FLAO|nr:hypothetical protein LPB138_08830 [Urechidicola croceus]